MGKRAWNSGFGGMGKRAWNSGFSGSLGKREDYAQEEAAASNDQGEKMRSADVYVQTVSERAKITITKCTDPENHDTLCNLCSNFQLCTCRGRNKHNTV